MDYRTFFRLSFVSLLIFQLSIGVAVFYSDDGALEPAWDLLPQSTIMHVYLSEYLTGFIILFVFFSALILASYVGVLLFRNWGRWLYLICTLLVASLSLFLGPTIIYGWENALWEIATLANGAIMAVMFFSPIRGEFIKTV